jgi:hypothetical protein
MTDTTFRGNAGGTGGAITLSGGNLNVNGVTFEGNTAGVSELTKKRITQLSIVHGFM